MSKINQSQPVTIGFLADVHNGAVAGLTTKPETAVQRTLLENYEECVEWFGHLDYMITAGDLIHGAAEIDHETDSKKDPADQSIDAANLLEKIDADKFVIVSGTPYHTGKLVQMEKTVAAMLKKVGKNACFRQRLRLLVNDWFRLEVRHKIGSSRVPYSRGTAPARARIWNVLNETLKASRGGSVPAWADLMVFAHVHYYWLTQDDFGTSITLPCFSASGGRFDLEQCDGLISVGAFKVEVSPNIGKGENTWQYQRRLYPVAVRQRWEKL